MSNLGGYQQFKKAVLHDILLLNDEFKRHYIT